MILFYVLMVVTLLLGNESLNFLFYNQDVNGYLYRTLNQYSANQYNILSQYTASNSVAQYTTHLDGTLYDSGGDLQYKTNITRAVTNLNTGNVSDYVADYSKPCAIACNRNIYTSNNLSTIWFTGSNVSLKNIQPFIENSDSSIESWSFSTLNINGGTELSNSTTDYLRIYYPNVNTYYTYNISTYKSLYNGSYVYNIPRSLLNENIVVRDGSSIFFELITTEQVERWYYS